ncbi:Hypothetical protein GbCGDNIH2_0503 [Granulibacter bethesdensis]|nr:Hypothetical protein GbCGDNIH2_0503 [Granulibacter bethesdensis]
MMQATDQTAEGRRLSAPQAWRRWGPYLSDRQWGTVREDYSAHGDAWDYFPFDHAGARAYRWGEDGLAGFGDDRLYWCLGLGLWNGRDPFLKERLFGLNNAEGNHGEDVKEIYFHTDGLPSHAFMRMEYKYPHAAFPYEALRRENAARGLHDPEYEIEDTGIFAESRYFDIDIVYAKGDADDILCRITVLNRGPDAEDIHLLPMLWARNIWSWKPDAEKPSLTIIGPRSVSAEHPYMPTMRWDVDAEDATLLFCENETDPTLFGQPTRPYCKNAINQAVVAGNASAVNPAQTGTRCAAWVKRRLAPGEQCSIRLRFSVHTQVVDPFADYDAVMARRQDECDEFYEAVQKNISDPNLKRIQRQAFAGMLWTKQLYYYDVHAWLNGDPGQIQPPPSRMLGRNADWQHFNACDVISMPDKWEYPWFASWDLACHCVTFALIDPDFAKKQLLLLVQDWFSHPNAMMPAYEWEFSDANPPLHAWATWRVYRMEQERCGRGDRQFLERMFLRLTMNFTWWVNRKDADGRNIFQGGFLGLDNIGIFDRSKPLPTGGHMSQSDGTAWMASYALNLMRIAMELAVEDPVYEDLAGKYFEHFLLIARAASQENGLWDEQDQFFYDVLVLPDGQRMPLRIRSLVGLIPLLAVATWESETVEHLPDFRARTHWLLQNRPDLAKLVSRWEEPGGGRSALLSLLRGHRIKKLLARMLDEEEFLSPHGIRGLSRYHRDHPYVFSYGGHSVSLHYTPGESDTGLFGGNSNWRGPVWMPVNVLLIEALREFHRYYSDDFRVQYPPGSDSTASLKDLADELSHRLMTLFLPGENGRIPALGDSILLQDDPGMKGRMLFHEYFHGDSGRGLGASHQTGWTGMVALLIDMFHHTPEETGV